MANNHTDGKNAQAQAQVLDKTVLAAIQALTGQGPKVHTAEIVRHGEKIIIPPSMPLSAAREILGRQMQYEEEYVVVKEIIDCAPWDGALALRKAMEQKFGIALASGRTVEGFFGPMKVDAEEHSVHISPTKKVLAPWGQFKIAVADGAGDDWIQTDVFQERMGARVQFMIQGRVRRKYQVLVKEVADLVRELIAKDSIYRGKAIRVAFTDEDGDPVLMVKPDFIDVTSADPAKLIFRRELEEQIGTTLYAPLVAREACALAGVPFKRGILLSGPYGTGKTLLAQACARLAQENRITFIYSKRASDLPAAYRFAQQYQPACIFIEDVDSVVQGEERTEEINEVLNIVDGVDTKDAEVMLILTTNHSEDINRAMLRKGRIDAILPISKPDAEAAARLIKQYGGALISGSANLLEVGEVLDNQNAATIREAVERAKLAHIWRTREAPRKGSISTEDLIVAAQSTVAEADLVDQAPEEELTERENAAEILGGHIAEGLVKLAGRMDFVADGSTEDGALSMR